MFSLVSLRREEIGDWVWLMRQASAWISRDAKCRRCRISFPILIALSVRPFALFLFVPICCTSLYPVHDIFSCCFLFLLLSICMLQLGCGCATQAGSCLCRSQLVQVNCLSFLLLVMFRWTAWFYSARCDSTRTRATMKQKKEKGVSNCSSNPFRNVCPPRMISAHYAVTDADADCGRMHPVCACLDCFRAHEGSYRKTVIIHLAAWVPCNRLKTSAIRKPLSFDLPSLQCWKQIELFSIDNALFLWDARLLAEKLFSQFLNFCMLGMWSA